MIPKKLISFKNDYLDQQLINEHSCVVLEHHRYHLAFLPYHLNSVSDSIKDILNHKVGKFDAKLGGILLSYCNLTLLSTYAPIINDSCFVHLNIEADFYLFKPTVDCTLIGIVNKLSNDHVGCLVHNYFNASILKPRNEDDDDKWIDQSVQIDRSVLLRITLVDLESRLPYIRAKYISVLIPEEDDDCMEIEELNSSREEEKNTSKNSVNEIENGKTASLSKKRKKKEKMLEENSSFEEGLSYKKLKTENWSCDSEEVDIETIGIGTFMKERENNISESSNEDYLIEEFSRNVKEELIDDYSHKKKKKSSKGNETINSESPQKEQEDREHLIQDVLKSIKKEKIEEKLPKKKKKTHKGDALNISVSSHEEQSIQGNVSDVKKEKTEENYNKKKTRIEVEKTNELLNEEYLQQKSLKNPENENVEQNSPKKKKSLRDKNNSSVSLNEHHSILEISNKVKTEKIEEILPREKSKIHSRDEVDEINKSASKKIRKDSASMDSSSDSNKKKRKKEKSKKSSESMDDLKNLILSKVVADVSIDDDKSKISALKSHRKSTTLETEAASEEKSLQFDSGSKKKKEKKSRNSSTVDDLRKSNFSKILAETSFNLNHSENDSPKLIEKESRRRSTSSDSFVRIKEKFDKSMTETEGSENAEANSSKKSSTNTKTEEENNNYSVEATNSSINDSKEKSQMKIEKKSRKKSKSAETASSLEQNTEKRASNIINENEDNVERKKTSKVDSAKKKKKSQNSENSLSAADDLRQSILSKIMAESSFNTSCENGTPQAKEKKSRKKSTSLDKPASFDEPGTESSLKTPETADRKKKKSSKSRPLDVLKQSLLADIMNRSAEKPAAHASNDFGSSVDVITPQQKSLHEDKCEDIDSETERKPIWHIPPDPELEEIFKKPLKRHDFSMESDPFLDSSSPNAKKSKKSRKRKLEADSHPDSSGEEFAVRKSLSNKRHCKGL